MIPIECPQCGRRGNIPPDRLMQRMHCKKCDAAFHMDRGGRLVLGEPPREGGKKDRNAGKPAASKKKKKRTDEVNPGLVAIFVEALGGIPKQVWGVLGLCIVAFFGWKLLAPIIAPPPQSLLARTRTAAEAFARKDFAQLEGIAVPGTSDPLKQWMDQAHAHGDNLVTAETTISVDRGPDAGPKSPTTIVEFLLPAQGDAASGRAVTVPMVWTIDRNNFYLDGKATLEALGKAIEDEKKQKKDDDKHAGKHNRL